MEGGWAQELLTELSRENKNIDNDLLTKIISQSLYHIDPPPFLPMKLILLHNLQSLYHAILSNSACGSHVGSYLRNLFHG